MPDNFDSIREELRALRDSIIELKTIVTQYNTTLNDHEIRLRELEKTRWPIAQISVLISLAAVATAIIIPFLL